VRLHGQGHSNPLSEMACGPPSMQSVESRGAPQPTRSGKLPSYTRQRTSGPRWILLRLAGRFGTTASKTHHRRLSTDSRKKTRCTPIVTSANHSPSCWHRLPTLGASAREKRARRVEAVCGTRLGDVGPATRCANPAATAMPGHALTSAATPPREKRACAILRTSLHSGPPFRMTDADNGPRWLRQ
jgi:hypothetical protein